MVWYVILIMESLGYFQSRGPVTQQTRCVMGSSDKQMMSPLGWISHVPMADRDYVFISFPSGRRCGFLEYRCGISVDACRLYMIMIIRHVLSHRV